MLTGNILILVLFISKMQV